jgi:entry exclusion lipoprotein TrbK
MRLTNPSILTVAALTAALLAGCEKKPEPVMLPEVSTENCKPENIAKLDQRVQQAFSSQCLRAGSFKPSEPKTW